MRSLKDTYRLYWRTLEFLKPGDSFVAAFLGLCTALLLLAGVGFAISDVLVPKIAGWPPGGNRDGAWDLDSGEYTLIIIGEGWKVMLTAGLFPGLFWIITWILCGIGQVIISTYRVTTAWMFSGEPPDPRRPLSPGSIVITMTVPGPSVEDTSGSSFRRDSHKGARPVITIDHDSHPSYILYHRRRSQGLLEAYSANRRASVSSNVTMPPQEDDKPDDSGTLGNGSRGRLSLQGVQRDGEPAPVDKGAEAPAR